MYEKTEQLKKGSWQQPGHTQVYGHQFADVKHLQFVFPDFYVDEYISKFYADHSGNCDVYEFGVYTGGTLTTIKQSLVRNYIYPRTLWGFDSFEGLPKEIEGRLLEGDHWKEGAFSACDALGVWDWSALEAMILEKIDYPNVKLIKGFYEDTLTADILNKHDFKPAMFVNIDVDLYKSTLDVLGWLFANKIVKKGTLLRYDDVNFIPETEGELRAHTEMCGKYGVECLRLSKEFFVVTNI
jgi:hypothetical protein